MHRIDAAPQRALDRSLGTLDLTLLGIGAIIGGGVFASIGTAAVGGAGGPGAGPSLSLSVALTAAACMLTALSYSELACRFPSAGSAYAYAQAAGGRPLAWTIGWCLTLEYAVANVAVALSWGDYALALLRMLLGPALPDAPLGGPALGAACVLGLTALLCRGGRHTARLNNLLVLFKVAILLLFVLLGLGVCGPAHLARNWSPPMPHGLAGTLYGSATMFFAFIGFDAVATAAEEARMPQRSVPRAICGSLAACALLYMAVAAVFTGIAPLPVLSERLAAAQGQPLLAVLTLLGAPGTLAAPLVALGALVAQTTALWAFQWAQARIFFAMARDGLLPAALGRVHRRTGVPHLATWTAGLLVAGLCLCFPIAPMLDLADIGTLFIFCVTNLCLPLLRRRARGHPAPRFVAPGGAYLCPLLACASCLGLMLCLPGSAWLALLGWLAAGLAVHTMMQRARRSAA